MILQKFLRIGKYEWARQRAYRANLVIWMIVIPLIFLVEYSVWTAVFSASGVDVVRGFTRTDLLVYYLLVHIVLLFTNTNVDKRISEQIKDGSLIKQVIKPMHFFWLTFAKHIWVRIFNLFILPSLVILGYLLIPEISVSPINFMLFLASVVLAMLLTFMYIFLFGLLAFWVKEIFGLAIMRNGISNFFSGALIPLAFFPAALQPIFYILPFQYMLFVPIQIFLGKYMLNQIWELLLIQLVWTLIFSVVCYFVWGRAKARFMGVGI